MNEEKKEVRKVLLDFRKCMLEQNIGEWTETDLSKPVGNAIHKGAEDIGIDEIARKIYHDGMVEVEENAAKYIRLIIENSTLVLYARQAILKVIDEVLKKENV